ncbi:hypothetical protein B0H14DRAFT_2640125 [Mycena olivaceomarginata]|nr:hypothetical protein B0H14DRAFT_2640125 [Mycena olivaceomarginata]
MKILPPLLPTPPSLYTPSISWSPAGKGSLVMIRALWKSAAKEDDDEERSARSGQWLEGLDGVNAFGSTCLMARRGGVHNRNNRNNCSQALVNPKLHFHWTNVQKSTVLPATPTCLNVLKQGGAATPEAVGVGTPEAGAVATPEPVDVATSDLDGVSTAEPGGVAIPGAGGVITPEPMGVVTSESEGVAAVEPEYKLGCIWFICILVL